MDKKFIWRHMLKPNCKDLILVLTFALPCVTIVKHLKLFCVQL